jgi:hypothetical protein
LLPTITAGAGGSAPANIKAMLDSAAKQIRPFPKSRAILGPDVSSQNALVQHTFEFDGMSTHDIALFKCISLQLTESFFIQALSSKQSLHVASIARFLLRHVTFSRLLALIASNNIVPLTMLLIHAVDASTFSFLCPASSSNRRTVDPGPDVLAAAEYLLLSRPLSCSSSSHFTALLNQSRKIEVLSTVSAPMPPPPAAVSGPVHISCNQNGDMYVCGAVPHVIQVFGANGLFKHDISIKNADGSDVHVKYLRATAIDWSTGNMYVTDRDTNDLHCITPEGQLIASLRNVLNGPRALSWCARSRRLAVADLKNNQVVILDSELNIIVKLNGPKPADKFQSPFDTAFDVNGFLYIADLGNSR